MSPHDGTHTSNLSSKYPGGNLFLDPVQYEHTLYIYSLSMSSQSISKPQLLIKILKPSEHKGAFVTILFNEKLNTLQRATSRLILFFLNMMLGFNKQNVSILDGYYVQKLLRAKGDITRNFNLNIVPHLVATDAPVWRMVL